MSMQFSPVQSSPVHNPAFVYYPFIGYSCYISHGTLTVDILLELPEIWTLLHRAVDSHFTYTEQSTNTGSCVLAIGLVCAWVEVPRPF